MRALAAAAFVLLECACARVERRWTPVDPAGAGPCLTPDTVTASGDPDLDDLAFLAGAWSYWNVDWGQTLFVARDDGGWLLTLASHGTMGRNETQVFRVAHVGGEVRFDCEADPCERASRALVERGERRAVFGEGDLRVTLGLSDDGCTLYVAWGTSDFAYEFVRMRLVGPDEGR